MTLEYKLIKRTNREGKLCIAPFIGEWNVWDIPESEYTPAVASAIKRAYGIGLRVMHEEVANSAYTLRHKLEIEQ